MTLAQYLDYQRLNAIKRKSAAETATHQAYEKQLATETLPALPKGTNGPAFTAPDKG